jgi:hypothetical protein
MERANTYESKNKEAARPPGELLPQCAIALGVELRNFRCSAMATFWCSELSRRHAGCCSCSRCVMCEISRSNWCHHRS